LTTGGVYLPGVETGADEDLTTGGVYLPGVETAEELLTGVEG